MRKDFFENLKAERTTYKEMIDFCCDNLVMNNYIIQELSEKGFYFEIENGTDYDEEEDYYYDVYQYFIIGSGDAERLKEYTKELVYYCEDLDLYILGVCHFEPLGMEFLQIGKMKSKNKQQKSPSGLFCNATTFARVRAFQVAKKQRTEKTTKEGILL